jgi:hypothetical protein
MLAKRGQKRTSRQAGSDFEVRRSGVSRLVAGLRKYRESRDSFARFCAKWLVCWERAGIPGRLQVREFSSDLAQPHHFVT